MSTEQIFKLQPDRTLYLRGFTGFGAAASLCETSPTGFTVCGVFRDMADFCVLVLFDADNTFEHYTVRYLPDFELSGMVLTFDLTYQGLQPIDSAKYSWIDWAQLDVIKADATDPIANPSETPDKIMLWDHATLKSGNYSVAQGTYQIAAPGGCTKSDRLTLFVNNAQFSFVSTQGGESAATVASTLANSINTYDWASFASSSVSVTASADSSGNLLLQNARTGHVKVAGSVVTWLDGIKFPGLAAGSPIYLGGTQYMVSAVTSPTTLTLTGAAAGSIDGSTVTYLAPYGGADGNCVSTYVVTPSTNVTLAVDTSVLQLSGGNSDDVTWTVSLDLTALGIDRLRQAWLTFAPQLTAGASYSDTEWTATFSNWSVTDPNNIRALRCAGPGSMRVGNDDRACVFSPSGWSPVAANNYWHGFAQVTPTVGASVTVKYACQYAHDLYLGTSLYSTGGSVDMNLDGVAGKLKCYANITPGTQLATRRLIRAGVPAGTHTLTITLADPFAFVFDYLEAAVPGDIPDALVSYPNVSPALDFDTDATYKVSPQRLLWHLTKLGFQGQINEYLGVFWWNQRKRVAATWSSATVSFAGNWVNGDVAVMNIGTSLASAGFQMSKSVVQGDTMDTIAEHFAQYINAASVAMRAQKSGAGELTIWTRTPNWGDTLAVTPTSAEGTITVAGNLNIGVDGAWQIDPAAANPINFPVRQWHADFFASAKALGLAVTTSFSMELVNPPGEDGSAALAWQARYANGTPVTTDTGFANLLSSQCAPIPNLTNYQKAVYTTMAGLQNAAGLTPWLQFGEFLWWFFSSMAQPVGYCAYTDPISIGLAQPHGLKTGDRVVISGVQGCTAANGTWTVTTTDDTHFTIPAPANGAWVASTGQVRGGSMAYYDAATATAAQTALGRPLYTFTCQDDDPGVNSSADVKFLAGRLKAHVDEIRTAVLAQYANAKFELLYPNDVNNPVCYGGANSIAPQGGRLNAAVNLPAEWMTKATSGLDRFKVEALSWGNQYLNLDLANQAIVFALTTPMGWDVADVAYLIPWNNGTCPWPAEFHSASTRGIALINLWAYDHLAMMSWPLPFPTPGNRSSRQG